ncbi:hypothetical protein HON22_00440 [Candidatus Peregrinibacteria bacterium]|jgi:hypothetical protein|nr:hypothetical protein [Candidatus Peregrinibacteria bacterium]
MNKEIKITAEKSSIQETDHLSQINKHVQGIQKLHTEKDKKTSLITESILRKNLPDNETYVIKALQKNCPHIFLSHVLDTRGTDRNKKPFWGNTDKQKPSSNMV